jgi:hypothetical protein
MLHATEQGGVYIYALWKVMTSADNLQLARYGSLLLLPDGGEITAKMLRQNSKHHFQINEAISRRRTVMCRCYPCSHLCGDIFVA